MKIEQWQIDSVKPYEHNPRSIPASAILKVAESIKSFGWRQPLVVDEHGVCICGHTRLLAAQKLGLTEVPVHVADGLTPAQVRAYRLMDNRSHQETSWDEQLLGIEIGELKALDIDLALTGFEVPELATLLNGALHLGEPLDESVANGISLCKCPECGHEHSTVSK